VVANDVVWSVGEEEHEEKVFMGIICMGWELGPCFPLWIMSGVGEEFSFLLGVLEAVGGRLEKGVSLRSSVFGSLVVHFISPPSLSLIQFDSPSCMRRDDISFSQHDSPFPSEKFVWWFGFVQRRKKGRTDVGTT
jgi:hypothetical protein